MDFDVALALGATVSATDPVAVVSILAESGAPKYLAVLIEGKCKFVTVSDGVLFSQN